MPTRMAVILNGGDLGRLLLCGESLFENAQLARFELRLHDGQPRRDHLLVRDLLAIIDDHANRRGKIGSLTRPK